MVSVCALALAAVISVPLVSASPSTPLAKTPSGGLRSSLAALRLSLATRRSLFARNRSSLVALRPSFAGHRSSFARNRSSFAGHRSSLAAKRSSLAAHRASHAPHRTPRPDCDTERVFCGVDDTTGKYPFVVALLLVNLRTCTGTLIAPTWVLTAAHCNMVTSIQYGNMTVSPRDIQSQSKLLKRIPHTSFRLLLNYSSKVFSDIAMILVEEVPLKVFAKVGAVDYRAIVGYQVNYAGLGNTRNMKGYHGLMADFTRPLQLADGVVVSCSAMYNIITPCICVAPRCALQQSVLPGDSGGPLFFDGKLVGVAHDLLRNPIVSMFMPVSPYLTWIQQVMTQEEQNNNT